MNNEKIIIKNGKIKKVKEKKKMTKKEIIDRFLFILSVSLFVLVLNNKINYMFFIQVIFIYFLFLILSNELILKLFNSNFENEENENETDKKTNTNKKIKE